MSITQRFSLNLIPNSSPIILHVDQYDHGAGRLVADLYDGSIPYTPASGATAIVQGTKPDKHGFTYNATISGSTVTIDLTGQMTAVDGRVCCQLVISEGSNRTGSFVFFLDVQKSALPDDTELSTSDYSMIEELLETATALNKNFPKIGTNGNWWYYDAEQEQYVDSGVDATITITIGTTTTLPAGSSATVTNSGTSTDPVFNFGIPKGDTGAKGDKGDKGDTGDTGAKGDTGATPNITMTATADATSSTTPSVNVTKSGTAENPSYALAFSGLKGAKGDKGEDGIGSITYDETEELLTFNYA